MLPISSMLIIYLFFEHRFWYSNYKDYGVIVGSLCNRIKGYMTGMYFCREEERYFGRILCSKCEYWCVWMRMLKRNVVYWSHNNYSFVYYYYLLLFAKFIFLYYSILFICSFFFWFPLFPITINKKLTYLMVYSCMQS